MHMNNKGRIMKEFTDWSKNAEASNIQISLVGDDINHWKGLINGPKDTPYEGGLFQIDIVLPPDYPYKPPKMKFDTKIWHPNISSQTGAICLDILKGEWSPALSIRTALLSLQALMCCAEPGKLTRSVHTFKDSLADDPQDAVVASQYKSDKNLFNKTAKEWTQNYASPKINEEKIGRLVEMGFTPEKCKEALEKNGWDETLALNYLLK